MSHGTFMYDELIEFQLAHSPFVGAPPQAPDRDYKIIFQRDWNDFFSDCNMPYVKDSAVYKDNEVDTGQHIYNWVEPDDVLLNPLFEHENVDNLTHASGITPSGVVPTYRIKVFSKTERHQQWIAGQWLVQDTLYTPDDSSPIKALYVTLDTNTGQYPNAGALPILTLNGAGSDIKIEYVLENDPNGVESLAVVVTVAGSRVYEKHMPKVDFSGDSDSIHFYMELHPGKVDSDTGILRMAAFQSSHNGWMSTYAQCFSEQWSDNFKRIWADEDCLDDNGVTRKFKETMRLRLDDLFLGSKQASDGYNDGQGNVVEALDLDKIKAFLNRENSVPVAPFTGDLDFGLRVGTQHHMLSIFDRVLNHGRYKDTTDDGVFKRTLNLSQGDAFGFTIRLHEAQNDNSISILLLCEQI